MATSLMTSSQRARRLAEGAAERIEATAAARTLLVTRGRLWATRTDGGEDPSSDVWLAPGDRLLMPAGAEWVVEGWPGAAYTLSEAPRPARFNVWAIAAAAWRRSRRRLQLGPTCAACA